MKRLVLALTLVLGFTASAKAASISIYTVAGANTYQNTANNPCIFFGPGGSACNSNPSTLPFVGDTGGGTPFVPNPLSNTYGDSPGEIAAFAAIVGRDFLLGLDINDDNTPQTLSNVTINFFNSLNTNIGNYTFAPALAVPNSNNGTGFADYILSAGCIPPTPSGANATCSNYVPFRAPVGTRSITFTFGLTGYNDGQDKLFLIEAGAGGVPTPFDIEPPATVPEPASLILLGTGLALLVGKLRTKRS